MRRLPISRKTFTMLVVLIPLLALFVFVSLRSGPLAPVSVTVTRVMERSITPGLFGIGTVAARYTYKIGPTGTGRLKSLDVEVGDLVEAGQKVGEIDPIDLDERIHAQEAAVKRAEAQRKEAVTRLNYAQPQATRYKKLLEANATSEELLAAKEHEQNLASAVLSAACEELSRVRAELAALNKQRDNLVLRAPAAGMVALRHVEPGSTLLAGQAVVEIIDPTTLWINVRFDQLRAQPLSAGLPASIPLRSQTGATLSGRVLRVEPVADSVTEETLAKVGFDEVPQPSPGIGELAEATIALPALPPQAVIPNAAIRRVNGRSGVWKLSDDGLQFAPLTMGDTDLDGNAQVLAGLAVGERIVVYSTRMLHARSRIRIVDDLKGVKL